MEDSNLQLRETFFKGAEEKLKILKKSRFFIRFCAINAILMFIFFIILMIVSNVWRNSQTTGYIDGNITRAYYISPDYIAGMAILGALVIVIFILNVIFSIIAVVKVGPIRDLTEEYFSNPAFNKNTNGGNNNWIINQLNYSNLSIKSHLSIVKILTILGIFIIPIVMYWISYYYINKTIDNYQLQTNYLKNFSVDNT